MTDDAEDRHRSLVDDLAALLDLDAGLREATLADRGADLTTGLRDTLDLDAGLNEIVSGSSRPAPSGDRPRPEPGSPRVQGTVKWFNSEKGFGMITLDSGQDVFLHFSAIEAADRHALTDGKRVELEIGQGSRGLPQAEHVRLLP